MKIYRIDYLPIDGLGKITVSEYFPTIEKAIERAKSFGVEIKVIAQTQGFTSLKSKRRDFVDAGFDNYPLYIQETTSKDGSELEVGTIKYYYA